jgi:hypothetical protein
MKIGRTKGGIGMSMAVGGKAGLLAVSVLAMSSGCGRTAPLPGDGSAFSTSAPDPVQGVWVNDDSLPGPCIVLNLELSFDSGAWEVESPSEHSFGVPGRRIDMGTYSIDGNAIDMTVTASSCATLIEVMNPSATFERHGDKMIVDWKSDGMSDDPAYTLYLRRGTVLSDLGEVGCYVGASFLNNPVKPLP